MRGLPGAGRPVHPRCLRSSRRQGWPAPQAAGGVAQPQSRLATVTAGGFASARSRWLAGPIRLVCHLMRLVARRLPGACLEVPAEPPGQGYECSDRFREWPFGADYYSVLAGHFVEGGPVHVLPSDDSGGRVGGLVRTFVAGSRAGKECRQASAALGVENRRRPERGSEGVPVRAAPERAVDDNGAALPDAAPCPGGELGVDAAAELGGVSSRSARSVAATPARSLRIRSELTTGHPRQAAAAAASVDFPAAGTPQINSARGRSVPICAREPAGCRRYVAWTCRSRRPLHRPVTRSRLSGPLRPSCGLCPWRPPAGR
jgi:hypothetical protein